MRLTLRRATQRVARAIKPDFDQPDWRPILRASRDAWREARRAARTGPGVLIATTVGGHPPSTTIESLLAVALTLRGARVHVTLCDERLPACLRSHITAVESDAAFAAEGPQGSTCAGCYVSGRALYRSLGLPVHLLSELVSAEESRRAAALAATIAAGEIPSFQLDGLNIGEHAQAGALRFYARGTLEDPASEAVLRRYFEAGLLTAFAIERLLDTTQIAAACFNHGIYIPHGVIGDVMRKRQVRLANWNPAYRKQTFIFSHGDTYHHTLMDEPVTEWEGVAWTAAREADLMAYLRSRWQGSQDWITFNANPEESRDAIARALNIDFQKPTIGLLTNVIWDAQLHYRANAFPNMMDWLIRTIAYFDRRRDLQLVIRVHPAEVTGAVPSRQTVVDELRQHFADAAAERLRDPSGQPNQHLRRDHAMRQRADLRDENGRRALLRRHSRHRRRGGMDPEQRPDHGRPLTGGLFLTPRSAPHGPADGRGDDCPCPALRLSLLLPADDPAARRSPDDRDDREVSEIPSRRQITRCAAAGSRPGPRHHLRRHHEWFALRLSR